MKIKELKEKNREELNKLLLEATAKLLDLNFKDANKQLKNVREIRVTRLLIARIKTLLTNQE